MRRNCKKSRISRTEYLKKIIDEFVIMYTQNEQVYEKQSEFWEEIE